MKRIEKEIKKEKYKNMITLPQINTTNLTLIQ